MNFCTSQIKNKILIFSKRTDLTQPVKPTRKSKEDIKVFSHCPMDRIQHQIKSLSMMSICYCVKSLMNRTKKRPKTMKTVIISQKSQTGDMGRLKCGMTCLMYQLQGKDHLLLKTLKKHDNFQFFHVNQMFFFALERDLTMVSK